MTGLYGTTSGTTWEATRTPCGSFDLFGKSRDGYTIQIGEIFDEDMDETLPALHNARAIAQVPAMLALVAEASSRLTPHNDIVEMARAIARELEKG